MSKSKFLLIICFISFTNFSCDKQDDETIVFLETYGNVLMPQRMQGNVKEINLKLSVELYQEANVFGDLQIDNFKRDHLFFDELGRNYQTIFYNTKRDLGVLVKYDYQEKTDLVICKHTLNINIENNNEKSNCGEVNFDQKSISFFEPNSEGVLINYFDDSYNVTKIEYQVGDYLFWEVFKEYHPVSNTLKYERRINYDGFDTISISMSYYLENELLEKYILKEWMHGPAKDFVRRELTCYYNDLGHLTKFHQKGYDYTDYDVNITYLQYDDYGNWTKRLLEDSSIIESQERLIRYQ